VGRLSSRVDDEVGAFGCKNISNRRAISNIGGYMTVRRIISDKCLDDGSSTGSRPKKLTSRVIVDACNIPAFVA
jgi:hypothetical protein